jgi:hypothetical protein
MNNAPPLFSETTNEVEQRPPLGQVAVVLMALTIGILLMGIQLWLLTIALDLYLAGSGAWLWLLVIISGLIFLGGLLMLRMLHHRSRSPREVLSYQVAASPHQNNGA